MVTSKIIFLFIISWFVSVKQLICVHQLFTRIIALPGGCIWRLLQLHCISAVCAVGYLFRGRWTCNNRCHGNVAPTITPAWGDRFIIRSFVSRTRNGTTRRPQNLCSLSSSSSLLPLPVGEPTTDRVRAIQSFRVLHYACCLETRVPLAGPCGPVLSFLYQKHEIGSLQLEDGRSWGDC